ALRERGIVADVVPERAVAEGLAQALEGVPVQRALVVRARGGREVLAQALQARGAHVDVIEVYETVAEPLSPAAMEAAREADYVTFTSASTVRCFCEAMDGAPALPAGVHRAVVDPGVGASGAGARRAVALRAGETGHALVGPDNGLLMPAAEALGGVAEAVDITRSPERLADMSATFHGRDLFAPVAAALAASAQLSQVGRPLDHPRLCPLELSRATMRGGALHTRVLRSDHFG